MEQTDKKTTTQTGKWYWDKRLTICKSCDKMVINPNRCSICGCHLALFLKLKSSICPENKW
jgi:anaerobic ribonucleoside-triphosphate reductase